MSAACSERQAAAPLNEARQVFAVEQLHHQECHSAFGADVRHINHVRVPHPRRQLSLAQEPRARVEIRGELRAHDFDRDLLSDSEMDPFVDRAHATLAYQAQHLVLPQAGPRNERGVESVFGLSAHEQPRQARDGPRAGQPWRGQPGAGASATNSAFEMRLRGSGERAQREATAPDVPAGAGDAVECAGAADVRVVRRGFLSERRTSSTSNCASASFK